MKGENVWRCDASLVQNKTMKMSEKKSNFSVTCSRLSQYLKREGSFKELKLDMASTSQTQQQPIQGPYRPPTTMSLLPGLDVSVEKQPDTTESDKSVMKSMEFFPQHTGFGSTDEKTDTKEPENAQLTIFYNGKVMVFDNLPVHKAQDLLQLAAKESLITNSATQTTTVADHLFVNCPATSDSEPMAPQSNPSELPMPIARRASLHRFFEKRKDRTPYQANASPSRSGGSSKPEETPWWLGLGQDTSSEKRR